MKTEELRAVVEDWKNEDNDRAVIMITSERLKGETMQSEIMIKGNKLNVLMSLFNFMEEKTDMMEEATKIGAMNKLLECLSEGHHTREVDKKRDAFSELLKLLKTKHS